MDEEHLTETLRIEQAKYDKLKEQVKLAEPNLEKISHWVRCHVKLREVLVERLAEGTQIHFTISTNSRGINSCGMGGGEHNLHVFKW